MSWTEYVAPAATGVALIAASLAVWWAAKARDARIEAAKTAAAHQTYNLDVVSDDKVAISCATCSAVLGITFISGWGRIAESHYYAKVAANGGE